MSRAERLSVIYHDIFDFPLNLAELIKWRAGNTMGIIDSEIQILQKNGYYFLEDKEGIIYKRTLRKRISLKKLEIAKKAARILSFIPSVKFIGVTGSLAMENATDESDIDLMIITKERTLWTTRLLSYLILKVMNFTVRSTGDKNEKDKLCLNIWLDEGDLTWAKKDRNIYSSHEICQVRPLVNKGKAYEKFLWENRWILKYWPNSVKIVRLKNIMENKKSRNGKFGLLESLAFWFQYQHMKSRITREVVTQTRALFHPQDWSRVVLDRIKSFS